MLVVGAVPTINSKQQSRFPVRVVGPQHSKHLRFKHTRPRRIIVHKFKILLRRCVQTGSIRHACELLPFSTSLLCRRARKFCVPTMQREFDPRQVFGWQCDVSGLFWYTEIITTDVTSAVFVIWANGTKLILEVSLALHSHNKRTFCSWFGTSHNTNVGTTMSSSELATVFSPGLPSSLPASCKRYVQILTLYPVRRTKTKFQLCYDSY